MNRKVDWKQLLELLQRKQRAASQDVSTLEPGDEIYLSLTALEEVKLKYLLRLAIAQEEVLPALEKQAIALFLEAIEKRREELVAIDREEYALHKVHDELASVLTTVLDEEQEGYAQILLAVCQERPDFFTVQPEAIFSCIMENSKEYRNITALHIVYHQLYDHLNATLEFQFCLWHQEQRRDVQ